MPRLCLNMIVRNEEAILERCLRAAASHIDCYVICDTGSTDGTVGLIGRVFEEYGVPGEIVHAPFENFEQARNAALDAARASSLEFDYLLLCDADMELRVEDPAFRDALTEPVYTVTQHNPASELGYQNVRLLRRDTGAAYGVTHEYVEAGPRPYPLFRGIHFLDHAAGSSRSVKYERDIALLTEGLEREPDNSRYVFYLAQSYRDSGDLESALSTYERRVAMGGWEEEVWYAAYQVAIVTERLGRDDADVMAAYLTAFQTRPRRVEPLVQLARYLRENGARYALAHLFAQRAIAIPQPDDLLFVDEGAYRWRALDEYSIACYWVGDHAESMRACRELLDGGPLPEVQRPRVIENLNYSLQKLGLPPEHGA